MIEEALAEKNFSAPISPFKNKNIDNHTAGNSPLLSG